MQVYERENIKNEQPIVIGQRNVNKLLKEIELVGCRKISTLPVYEADLCALDYIRKLVTLANKYHLILLDKRIIKDILATSVTNNVKQTGIETMITWTETNDVLNLIEFDKSWYAVVNMVRCDFHYTSGENIEGDTDTFILRLERKNLKYEVVSGKMYLEN